MIFHVQEVMSLYFITAFVWPEMEKQRGKAIGRTSGNP
ncbi:hypothetical protein KP509_26G058100 [Ceratopteris richardii]|uniref:Uncharacterized protein n=1 Tax=Ceratopteris richardii TaxID=49495 RepID=A0A8T2RMJ1_CERRI|nr:hypothetical protein KP509_26G058100 [Ceratopteris richardii]